MTSPFLFFFETVRAYNCLCQGSYGSGLANAWRQPAKSGFAMHCRYSPVLERMTHDCLDIGVLTQSIKRILDAQPRLFMATKGYMR